MSDKKIDLREHAVIVVDMINDYLNKDSKLYCEVGLGIVDSINRLNAFVRQKGGKVVFCNTSIVSETDPIARLWGMHALRGTSGEEVFPELEQKPGDLTALKTAYNGFFQSSLDDLLKEQSIKTVSVVGIHTHVCVLLTASAAFDHGYEVFCFEDAMTTGYTPNHDTRLRFFRTHIGELMSVESFINQMS